MRFPTLILGVLCVAACEDDTNTGDDDDDDGTEAELLALVEDDLQLYDSWSFAPAIEGVQVSTNDFHSDWVSIWYNDEALASLETPAEGVSAFKEGYSDVDGNILVAINAMRYADGYGWFYAEITAEKEIEEYGRYDECIECHESGGADGFIAPDTLGSP